MSQPLKDDEVQREMSKMISFILQEAEEKSREIRLQTESSVLEEHSRILRDGRVLISQFREKREKQLESERKIAHSNRQAQAKIQVLESYWGCFDAIVEETKKRLGGLKHNEKEYRKLFYKLALQALYRITEQSAIVQCVKSDLLLLQAVADDLASEYTQTTGQTIKLTVDTGNFLPDSVVGGVSVSTLNGRIRCTNTLESRLMQVSEGRLPEMRRILYGEQRTALATVVAP